MLIDMFSVFVLHLMCIVQPAIMRCLFHMIQLVEVYVHVVLLHLA